MIIGVAGVVVYSYKMSRSRIYPIGIVHESALIDPGDAAGASELSFLRGGSADKVAGPKAKVGPWVFWPDFVVLCASLVGCLVIGILVARPAASANANPESKAGPTGDELLNTYNKSEAPSPYQTALSTTGHLENVLTAGKPLDEGKIGIDRGRLIALLKEKKDTSVNDPRVLSVTTYGLLLCALSESSSDKWKKVQGTADWAVERLPRTQYDFAFRIYQNEALVQESQDQSLQAKVNAYRQLLGEPAGVSTRLFVTPTPDNFQKIDGRAFVTARLDELKLQAHIEIHGPELDGASLAQALNAEGLDGVLEMGQWRQRYLRPYIYYRKGSGSQSLPRVSSLVSAQVRGKPLSQNYVNAPDKNKDVKDEFEANRGLDLLIILPSTGTR